MNASPPNHTDKNLAGENLVDHDPAENNRTANPPAKEELDSLLERYGDGLAGKVWRGKQAHLQRTRQHHTTQHLASGYQALDALLHGGGWPLHTSTEFSLSQPGIGELRLLMPALRQLQQQQTGNIMLIAPPLLPFAPALHKEKIDSKRLTIVQTSTLTDTLWAAEQALLAECCTAVFTWTGQANLGVRELRRLQLASERGRSWNVLFRHTDSLQQASTAGLRMQLQSNGYSQLEIKVLKQPQGWGGQSCVLSLQPHYENWQRLPAHLLPHHNRKQTPALPVEINTHQNLDQQQASVTVLAPLSALQTVH